jgi:leucyl-tRNA synthetase
VVNPDEVIAQYGADSFRLYEMFMGPLQAVKPWNTQGVEGLSRFLNRSWRMVLGDDNGAGLDDAPMSKDLQRVLHQTIKKVTVDAETLDFNTAISQLMICLNEFTKAQSRNRQAMETYVLLLAPFAPHLCEELWQRLGHEDTLTYEAWPEYDEACLKVDSVEILVQINGKPKSRLDVPAGADRDALQELALADETIKELLQGKQIRKVIAVPGRLVNIVAN